MDASVPAGDGDILHIVLLPRNGLALYAGAGLELPQLMAIGSIERLELTGQLSSKHNAACRL